MTASGSPGRFGGVLTAMVTPFDDDGRLDIDGATTLARWLVDHGNEGLVVAGTTGEAPTLTDDEMVDLWRAVSEAVTVPVLAGTGSNDTRHAIELSKRAAGCGVAGLLVVTPYYNRPSQAGLEAHFRAVAAATDLPVMLYDIPVRSGRKISHDVMLRLANEVPSIVGVKDAAGDTPATARLIAEAPSSFEVYSGNDSDNFAFLALGAVGVIGVATAWTGDLHVELLAAINKGDLVRAREVHARLLPSYRFENSEEAPNPLPTKAVLRVLGLPGGRTRPPMDGEPADLEDRARAVLRELGLPAAGSAG